MKLTLANIIPTSSPNPNTVHGTLDGKKVEVSRFMTGWTRHICVKVNDTIFHSAEASEEDRKQFTTLSQLAWDNQYAASEKHQKELMESKAFQLLYTKE